MCLQPPKMLEKNWPPTYVMSYLMTPENMSDKEIGAKAILNEESGWYDQPYQPVALT